MAVAIDFSDEVLRIFVDSHRNEMTLIELHNILSSQVKRITSDEVLRIIRSSSLVNLFNLQPISNDLCLIQLNPKLTLCEACLQRSCKKMNCSKLHICCIPPHFSNKTLDKHCHFPHKLSEHSNNVSLLRRFNYDTLNEDLLLDLLRLYYRNNNEQQAQTGQYVDSKRSLSSQNDRNRLNNTPLKTPNHRLLKSRPPSQMKKSPIQPLVVTDNVIERQLDISIPSERDASDVDLEIVQLVLATKDIIIERTLEKQISNEFYRRYTLQFKNKQIVDKILQNEPVIIYNNVPIKLKRTIRQKDTRIFALKFNTDQKIDDIRLNLYVETLVGKVNSNIFDMTIDGNDEQIHLIRCEQPIDFDHLYKVHSSKNTLQGHRITIVEVYEAESLEVSFIHGALRRPLTIQRLRELFGETRWQQDVFACICIRDQNNADIELMNAEVTAKWIADAHRIEQDLSVIIHPIIDFIQPPEKEEDEGDDDEEITKLLSTPKTSSPFSPSNVSDDSPKGENESNLYRIRQDWRIVLTHPTFGDEYRKYIRENLNISIQITGSSIQVPNEYVRKELARYTNMFIQKFAFQEFSNLDKAQVKLIKDNYSRMAHKWQRDINKTFVAARRDVMNELFPRPGSATRQQNKPLTTPTFRYRQTPTIKRPDPQSIPPVIEKPAEESFTNQSQIKPTETDQYTLPYSIENSVYFPFFALSNSFSNRLTAYLSNTFNIKLDIKPVSSTKLLLELKGQHKDVCDARPALVSLFASLKTKTYSDANDSCKFAIPDVSQVAQWNLDQCSIVSSCSFSTKNGGILSVRYFADNPQFGVDEQKLDDIILHKLLGVAYQVLITSKKLEMNLEELEKKIRQRPDYGQDLCCLYNYQKESIERSRLPSMYLCGTKHVVQQMYQDVKRIGEEYAPVPCNVQLTSNQVNYLLHICSANLIKFEKDYETDGVDLRSKLKGDTTSQFLAPKYLHEKIKVLLFEMSQIQMVSKDFKCSIQSLNNKTRELNDIALQNRCLLSMTLSSQSTPSNRTTSTTSKISSGTINVSNGDLTKEQSEVLVICSSSAKLCEIVRKAAGTQVEQELSGKDLTKTMIDTSTGQLKQAKRLLFLPWTPPDDQDINALRQSISTFVQQAIKFTIQGKFKSIAFPAIGCGGFNIQPDIIATIMIDTAREQLIANPTVPLAITFVVQQSHVYDVFHAKIKSTSTTATASRTRSPSPSRLSTQEKVNITLTTSNSNIDTAKKLLGHIEQILA